MQRDKFNQFSFTHICYLIEVGKNGKKTYNNYDEFFNHEANNFNMFEWEFIYIGFKYPDFQPEAKEFYRIGEPRINIYGGYHNSYNFAEDRSEEGISVVTIEWLHSFKSIFFGTSDEKIKARGVYKIKGFALPAHGGDDEPLIIPLDWAKKTKIRTRSGLEKVIKKNI